MRKQSAGAVDRSASPWQSWASGWRARTVGLGQDVPLLDGRLVPYVSLDNAASTPPLSGRRRSGPALPAVLLERPSRGRLQVTRQHRGLSRRARDARAFRWSRDDDQHRDLREEHDGSHQQARLPLSARRAQASCSRRRWSTTQTICPGAAAPRSFVQRSRPEGRVDEDDVDRLLAAYGERIALMTVSGASNVTGFVQPVHRLARKAHAVGADILVDAAQLAPHRRIDVKAGRRPGASRFRGALRPQDVRALRHGRAGWPSRHLPARRARIPGRRHGRYRDAR